MRRKIWKIAIIILVILLGAWSIFCLDSNKTKEVNTEALSNKKIEWGIKRNGKGKQPDVGIVNKQAMDENNGIYLGNKDQKAIYLTFDLGYEAGYTENILNVLKENNATATFFVTAHYINTASDLIEKMIADGNIVGNHTVNHKCMPELNEEELTKEVMTLHDTVKEKFNYEMKYIRPPKGEYSLKSLAITNLLGYRTVMWSFAYADWDEAKQPSKEEATNKIMENLHNGEVMLLHGTSKTNSEILGNVLKQIKNEGYEIKSIDDFEK